MMKKVLASLLACMMLIVPMMVPVSAAQPPDGTTSDVPAISFRAEQTETYYRFVGDQLQYRIWSLTYGYWKTDWKNV